MPEMENEDRAEEPPGVIDEETAKGNCEFETICDLSARRRWAGQDEGHYKRAHCRMDGGEDRKQEKVQDASPFPIRQRNRHLIEDPDERQQYDPFQKVVSQ